MESCPCRDSRVSDRPRPWNLEGHWSCRSRPRNRVILEMPSPHCESPGDGDDTPAREIMKISRLNVNLVRESPFGICNAPSTSLYGSTVLAARHSPQHGLGLLPSMPYCVPEPNGLGSSRSTANRPPDRRPWHGMVETSLDETRQITSRVPPALPTAVNFVCMEVSRGSQG